MNVASFARRFFTDNPIILNEYNDANVVLDVVNPLLAPHMAQGTNFGQLRKTPFGNWLATRNNDTSSARYVDDADARMREVEVVGAPADSFIGPMDMAGRVRPAEGQGFEADKRIRIGREIASGISELKHWNTYGEHSLLFYYAYTGISIGPVYQGTQSFRRIGSVIYWDTVRITGAFDNKNRSQCKATLARILVVWTTNHVVNRHQSWIFFDMPGPTTRIPHQLMLNSHTDPDRYEFLFDETWSLPDGVEGDVNDQMIPFDIIVPMHDRRQEYAEDSDTFVSRGYCTLYILGDTIQDSNNDYWVIYRIALHYHE